jgi:hypothetical protein
MYRLAFRVDATQVIADEWAGLGTRRAVTPLLKVLSLSDDEATVRASVSQSRPILFSSNASLGST